MKIKLLGWFIDNNIKGTQGISFNYFLDIDGKIVANYSNINKMESDNRVFRAIFNVVRGQSDDFKCIQKNISDKNIKCIESQILKDEI